MPLGQKRLRMRVFRPRCDRWKRYVDPLLVLSIEWFLWRRQADTSGLDAVKEFVKDPLQLGVTSDTVPVGLKLIGPEATSDNLNDPWFLSATN